MTETAPAAIAVLCSRLPVTLSDLRGYSRTPHLVRARAVAARLLSDFHCWNTDQVADYLGRSTRQAQRLIRDGTYLETRNVDGAGELCHDIRHAAVGALR